MDPVEAFPKHRAAKARLEERHDIDLERSFRGWLGDLTGRDPAGVDELIAAAARERPLQSPRGAQLERLKLVPAIA